MATISGTVKDSSGSAAARLVRAYLTDSGELQATTTSAQDGTFTISVPFNRPHFIVCTDAIRDTSCVVLMHFDGENNSTTFTEETGKTVTRSAAVISTTTSRFGGASGYFNGSAYVSIPSSSDTLLGASDFSVEFDCAVASPHGAGYFGVLSKYVSVTGGRSYSVDLYGDGSTTRFALLLSTSGDTTEVLIHALTSAVIGQMYHIEFSRVGGTVYFFLDGVLQGTANIGSSALYANSQPLTIGGRSNYAALSNVYVDELRIRKTAGNVAAYAGDLPTKPYSLLVGNGGNALIFDGVTPA